MSLSVGESGGYGLLGFSDLRGCVSVEHVEADSHCADPFLRGSKGLSPISWNLRR
jgi:hypothetical protein